MVLSIVIYVINLTELAVTRSKIAKLEPDAPKISSSDTTQSNDHTGPVKAVH